MGKSFDAIRFCKDHHIVYSTEGKNVRPGWVHMRCPFCDDRSNHLGINPDDGSVACWRCKAGSLASTIAKVLSLPFQEAVRVVEDYQGASYNRKSQIANRVRRTTSMEIPGDDLTAPMRKYLTGRGFDPDYLVKEYGIKGLTHGGIWEGIDFSYRIVIPVMDLNGRVVSFQARDYTGKQELRWKNCPLEKSIIDPKETLYGSHLANRNRVVVVEGIFDMWRMGPGFVCSFGTSMKESQLRSLSNWKEVTFMFDPGEIEAQEHAKEYAKLLASIGIKTSVVEADMGKNPDGSFKDPAEFSEEEARYIRRELLI